MLISEFTKSTQFVDMQNDLINSNISYREQWELECKDVMMSYKGNKFPAMRVNKNLNTSKIIKDNSQNVYVNLIKRQYRTTANFLLNNEPQFIVTWRPWKWSTEADLVAKRQFLANVFDWMDSDQDEIMSFYDTVMDDVIYYWMFRGLVWTMVYYDKEKKSYEFKSFDSMDTFFDISARSLRNVKKLVFTYTKNKSDLKTEYKVDWFWDPIDWDEVNTDKKESKSDVKQSMLKDKPKSESLIIREWYYLEWKIVYRILTSETKFLKMEQYPIWFFPFTYFTPMNEPENLYPRGWYVDMVVLEREINMLIDKINKIVKTWGRYVYIKEWTTLTKGTNNILNSLDIEVIEVSEAQDLPQQATLMQVSQSDIQHLDFLMKQADMEWWMQSDIMGNSSLWADASGRAIQALQAGSKNNIGPVLNELNKYMNRLVLIVLKMHDIYWENEVKVAWEDWDITVSKKSLNSTSVKVQITWRDAFDEVTKQIQWMQILDYILKFKPDTPISPNTITEIFWSTNDIATKIQNDIDKEINPDIQISEGENKKLMNAIPLNANPSDDHKVHMAMHSELLKNFQPESDAWKAILAHLNMHDAFLQSAQ